MPSAAGQSYAPRVATQADRRVESPTRSRGNCQVWRTECQVYLSHRSPGRIVHRTPWEGTIPDWRLENRLKLARAERGLSQEQLASLAGVTRQTISSIETGQYVPSALLAFVLAERLGKRVDELFTLAGGGA